MSKAQTSNGAVGIPVLQGREDVKRNSRGPRRLAALLALLLVAQGSVLAQDSPLRPGSGPRLARDAAAYEQFVVAKDVVTRYVNGELRFCQRLNLKGMICGHRSKIFGKEFFEIMDWWNAQTFAQAYTGLPSVEVTRITFGPDDSSLVIHFRP